MSDRSAIAWTDATWNPVRGCSRVSAGCANCYAERQAIRQSHAGYAGLVRSTPSGPRWTGAVRLVPEALDQPLRWRKPRRIFVNSMSDLFHESLSDRVIDRVFAAMARAPHHTFQVLTKRPERMRAWFKRIDGLGLGPDGRARDRGAKMFGEREVAWPIPNVWLGVSVEDQATADARIPVLLDTPAAVRFVSAEPLLDTVDLSEHVDNSPCDHKRQSCEDVGCRGPRGLDWVIVGGESGPGARPCAFEWLASIVEQCRFAEVACFVKQLGAHYIDSVNGVGGVAARPDPTIVPRIRRLCDRKGADPAEWPSDLRIQQFPASERSADPEPARQTPRTPLACGPSSAGPRGSAAAVPPLDDRGIQRFPRSSEEGGGAAVSSSVPECS